MLNYKKLVHYLLLATAILYLITGFGITNWQIVEPLTLGLLGKALSQYIHLFLAWVFIPLLAVHVYFTVRIRIKKPRQ